MTDALFLNSWNRDLSAGKESALELPLRMARLSFDKSKLATTRDLTPASVDGLTFDSEFIEPTTQGIAPNHFGDE